MIYNVRKADGAIGLLLWVILAGILVTLPATAQEAIPVEAAKVVMQDISSFEYAQGTAKATRREYLVFENSGRIAYVKTGPGGAPLREGDKVAGPGDAFKNGELLAELDSGQTDANMKGATATLEKARAQLQVADSELKRSRQLFKKKVINQKRLEETVNAYNQAVADVRSAEARIDEVESGVRRGQLRAPFDGVVAFINIREGQYATPQQFDPTNEKQAARTAPIVVIDPTSFEVIVDLPVYAGSRVKVGQRAFIFDQEALAAVQTRGLAKATRAEIREYTQAARVTSISPAVNPEDRSIRVRIETDKEARRLLDGGFITVWIEVARKEKATVIPISAVVARGEQFYAYIINKDNTVSQKVLKMGVTGPDGVEVISGLKPGDTIITKGNSRVRDGSRVRVVGRGK